MFFFGLLYFLLCFLRVFVLVDVFCVFVVCVCAFHCYVVFFYLLSDPPAVDSRFQERNYISSALPNGRNQRHNLRGLPGSRSKS